ncbi:mannonate dehydratase [Lacibacter cauensis]|uniref:Mannonate dehydratase n=1 Tax=Lacibacter cauensis TaxID=510947 RepID=A0A562SWZ6_9BACT|nr:mannonate dehydratase [Lacibacter cauensis]TWI85558.1 mannonate dehydratase [Lacibacter cauensis]
MLMHQTMRWYGPNDPVSLADIRQAGCAGVVTALHHIPVGDIWTSDEILLRKKMIEDAGMTWTVIESLPVSDDIKRQSGNYLYHIENYKASLRNVAACGLKVVTYNFMPVLDWLRTNVYYQLEDGSTALYFNRIDYVVFDLFLLKRPEADAEYDVNEIVRAKERYDAMSEEERTFLFNNMMLGLPGSDDAFTPEQVLTELEKYQGIDAAKLKEHLFYFLKEVVPVAEECGLKMAIHPDDPPYPVLGLPRIMSTEQDAADLLEAVPSAANGFCFCTGSFGARADNNVPAMLKRFGDHVHFLHLRNTKRDAEGNFFEADHLAGDTDMYEVIKEVLSIQHRRNISLPMRPDHGHQMLDDLKKKTYPGYSAIGRLKGLAELRGVEYALFKMLYQQ